MATIPEAPDQWAAATRVLLGLLRLHMEKPGALDPETLPAMLQMASDERDRQGDYGAARMLEDWAFRLTIPLSDWED